MSELKPILITRGITVLPYEEVEVDVGRPKSIEAIKLVMKSTDRQLIMITQRNYDQDEVHLFRDVYDVGTLVEIVSMIGDDEDGYKIVVRGIKPVGILADSHKISEIEYEYYDLIGNETLSSKDLTLLDRINSEIFDIVNNRAYSKDIVIPNLIDLLRFEKDQFPYLVAAKYIVAIRQTKDDMINFEEKSAKYRYEIINQSSRVNAAKVIRSKLFDLLADKEAIKRKVDDDINALMNEAMQKQQREFFLREKLKTVREQLGELSSREDEADKMRKKLENKKMPAEVKEKALTEISRFESAMSSNESSVIKAYLDWILDLPWSEESTDNTDLEKVKKVLDSNHYGIEKVKERILEYISLRVRNNNIKAPIICLVGPPGVGKTSLVSSIAEALDKPFVKVSLGGVKDESEIRGHRKTYVGAMPGRIIKGMKKAGVVNPLFLLDEIDKMGSDHKGDPASAMLEVLDPEQNKRFSDHFIEEEYDLSKVMFVATANYYQQIPYALIDRLEIIELSSYTAIEKREIAKTHLIPRRLADVKLDANMLVFSDEVIDFIINHYTKEAGVRELDRQISHVVRKYIVEQLFHNKDKFKPIVLTVEKLKEYLGKIKFDYTHKDEIAIPGIVNGMAYTSAGGDLLPIEVNYSSNGKGGNVVITGNLEKTMNESVNVALGFVRANADKYGIDKDLINFKDIDIHVHVPQGGIPKDGPSAGIAITTAIISALTNRPVDTKISMTGEIMLRGLVGIIGGVKEKIISAYRGGVREIFLPYEDERYLEDVPQYILDDIKIHLVRHYDEVYEAIFNKNKSNSNLNKKVAKQAAC
ncbi:endopeptidase La [Ureaplasma diversum]|uniref:endopeptidase La n=1 Tax=Ureaplasma diversum TaxID=42094 RepID=UPI000B15402E|nr:endopeptidase La [Ureaplasma diversum]